jgi:DmsE family decaheme c-type cytochrome
MKHARPSPGGARTAARRPSRGALLLAAGALPLLLSGPARAESPCAPCHGEQVEAASKGPHAGIAARGARYCEACHGDATRHLADGSTESLRGKAALAKAAPAETSRMCLTCHRGAFPGWEGTDHARSGEVSCLSCHGDSWHDPKGKGAKKRGESACASCHVEAVGEFRRVYRHPVPEGRMGCASCHDVHGKSAKGAKGPESTCLDCHAEAAGPWVFPHRAMEDGCSSCHVPHGSVNRSLLKTSGNGVCLACHVQTNFPAAGKVPHNRYLAGGGKCLDCHSEVHGSNVDERMAPQYRKR